MTDRRGYNVNIFAISKRLRRRMRRWRRAIWTSLACLLVAIMAWRGLALSKEMEALMTNEPMVQETLSLLKETDNQEEGSPD
ncbi:Tripartite ATP-independent periplasmic transporter, DctQ component [compost metagenome]